MSVLCFSIERSGGEKDSVLISQEKTSSADIHCFCAYASLATEPKEFVQKSELSCWMCLKTVEKLSDVFTSDHERRLSSKYVLLSCKCKSSSRVKKIYVIKTQVNPFIS